MWLDWSDGTISQWTLFTAPNRITHMSVLSKLDFGKNLRRLRESQELSQETLADKAEFDRSYIGGIERGERNPSLAAIFRLALALGIEPQRLFSDSCEDNSSSTESAGVSVSESKSGLTVEFRYDQFDAEFEIPGGTKVEFEEVLDSLKKGLAKRNNKANAVAEAYLSATAKWPNSNSSDLWTFLVNRTYCDRSNHPPSSIRLNLEQSWKRTSGWALERVLVTHYGSYLASKGISIEITNKDAKASVLSVVGDSRVVPDKADVLILYDTDKGKQLLGVIHVKASLAERRTDDVPMSQALIEAGYVSIFGQWIAKAFLLLNR